jgi:RNA polymerase sigma-70 factor (ECF subfamily)
MAQNPCRGYPRLSAAAARAPVLRKGTGGIILSGRRKKDDVAVIERLHRQYAGVLYDHCLRMLSDPQEAEDAVQETFINAFRSLSSFRYGESHLPWLYRIATNVSLKFIRTRRRKGTALLDHPDRLSSPGGDPGRGVDYRRALEQVMDSLDERGQEIVASYYVAGMDQGQIAESLGISRRAVVKRLTALRERVGRLFEEDDDHG